MSIFDEAEKWLDKQLLKIKERMNKIIINDESFDVAGRDIVVKRNTVIVNGKVIKDDLSGTVKIEFQGGEREGGKNTKSDGRFHGVGGGEFGVAYHGNDTIRRFLLESGRPPLTASLPPRPGALRRK